VLYAASKKYDFVLMCSVYLDKFQLIAPTLLQIVCWLFKEGGKKGEQYIAWVAWEKGKLCSMYVILASMIF
jgi:hypothetical protein